MIRSSRFAAAVGVACCFLMSTVMLNSTSVLAQENAEAGAEAADGTGIGFAPITVQDEGSLTQKASFFIGYNMLMNINRSTPGAADLDEMVAGMKAASEGIDKQSFIAGYSLFKDFTDRGFNLELAEVQKGMSAASAGEELGMSDEEVRSMMMAYQKIIEEKQIAKMKAESAANLAEGEAYIKQQMSEKPEAKLLENGVMYEVLTAGTGAKPTAEDTVTIDYHGTFIDGTVFDSSVKPPSGRPAEPISMQVARFVPGFSKTLQNMTAGSKWRIVIPGPEAYGPGGGADGAIAPNQTLIFELTLLEIEK